MASKHSYYGLKISYTVHKILSATFLKISCIVFHKVDILKYYSRILLLIHIVGFNIPKSTQRETMQFFRTLLQRNKYTKTYNAKSHTPSFIRKRFRFRYPFFKRPYDTLFASLYTQGAQRCFSTPLNTKKINCLPMFCRSHVEHQFRPNCGRRAAIQFFYVYVISRNTW